MKLIVTHAFGRYQVGDEITSPDDMKDALLNNAPQVVKTADTVATVSSAASK